MGEDILNTLKLRYAKGEISRKEFERMKKELVSESKEDQIDSISKIEIEKNIEFLGQYPEEDKFLSKYLSASEHVITKYKNNYATNKRLITYEKGLTSESFSDIAYSHISSLQLKNKVNTSIILVGIVVFLLGIFSLIFVLMGILLIVIGFLFKSGYYEIHGTGGEFLYVPVSGDIVATQFVKVIRDHLKS